MAATAAITSASTAVRLGDRNRNPNRQLRQFVTSSRDKSFIVWHLTKEDRVYGLPRRRLTSHSHFVEDVIRSSDGQFAIFDNWDQTIVFSEIMNPNGQ